MDLTQRITKSLPGEKGESYAPLPTGPNLLYRYAPQDHEYIQTIISSKPEFSSLALDNGPSRKMGKLFVHQVFAQRMVRVYDYFIIFNEVGTGKTGVMYSAANHCAKYYGMDPVIAYRRGVCNTIRRVVFLAPNEANMRNVEGEYRRYTDEASRLGSLPEAFVFSTHGAWWTENRGKSVVEIKGEWDNTLFIIDEVHMLLTRSNIEGKMENAEDEPEMYRWYRETFSKLRSIKIMLLTASILVERSLELGYYLRMFPGVQVPTDDEFYKSPTAAEELAPYLRGKVSYVKAVSAKAVRVYPDGAIPLDDLMPGASRGTDDATKSLPTYINTGGIKLILLTMSKMQTEEYLAVARMRRAKDTNVALERRISLITYTGTKPAPRKGGRGHKKPTDGIAPPPSLEFLSSLKLRTDGAPIEGSLDERSVKLAYVLRNIRKGGVTFIVTSYVEHGTKVIAAVLSGNGYQQLNPKDDHLSSRKNRVRLAEGIDPMNSLPKAPRFAVIGDSNITTPSDIIRLTTYCNRDENVFGEYLQVVIVSPAGSTGLNVYHVVDYFEMDTSWNGEQEAQREGRVFRATSHDAQWRAQVIKKNGSREPIQVRMHHLVAVPDYSIASSDVRVGDLYDYQHIYTKDAPLRFWRRLLMGMAYDAQIHFGRNNVPPYDPRPLREDRTTYDLIYAPEEIVALIGRMNATMDPFSHLAAILMRVGSIDADVFWDRYGDPRYARHSFYLALSRITRDRSELVTPLGTHVYVRAAGNMLFGEAVRYIRGERPRELEYYPDTAPYLAPLVYRTTPLADIVTVMDTTREDVLPFADTQAMLSYLEDPEIELAAKIEAIERILAIGMDQGPVGVAIFQAVRARYLGKSYFEYPRYGAILKAVEAYASLDASEAYQFSIPTEEEIQHTLRLPSRPMVRLHNLYAQFDENKQTHYGTYDNYMGATKLRIYDPKTRSFVAMPPDSPEFIVYSRIASSHIQKRYASLRARNEGSLVKMLVYDPENKLRVFNQMSEPRISKTGDMVKSTLPSGRVLATVSAALMIDISLYLELYPDELPPVPPESSPMLSPESLEHMRKELLDSRRGFNEVLNRERYDDPVELWKMYTWAKYPDLTTIHYLKTIVYVALRERGLVFYL